jgi:beta-lactam-binding protein with PASTA domain
VLAQTPAAGSSLPLEGTVDLTVAKAPAQVLVPNVEGAAKAAASAALERAGLKVKTVSGTTTEQSQVGVVIAQSPATVTITVGQLAPHTTPTTTSTGTTPVTPPAPANPPAAGE